MSCQIHRAEDRGQSELGWLSSRFSFSFAEYHNPARMAFGALRVINDDHIEAGTGFGMHPHRDMEIITIVLKGGIEHRDSEGHHGITHAGEIQYMSAGTGIYHSEHALEHEDTELFQIWIFPDKHGYEPLYEQRDFRSVLKEHGWHWLISPDGKDHSIKIRQNASIRIAKIDDGETLDLSPAHHDQKRLLFIIEGTIEICDERLNRRDEIQITDQETYSLKAITPAKLLCFDIPPRQPSP